MDRPNHQSTGPIWPPVAPLSVYGLTIDSNSEDSGDGSAGGSVNE